MVIPCNSWLFLLRVRAIPHHAYSRIMLAICTFLWGATFTSFLILFGVQLTKVPSPPGECFYETVFKIRFLCAPFIVLIVFDTAVCLSVLLGLSMCDPNATLTMRVKSTMLMGNTGPLCRVILESGYIDYMSVKNSVCSIVWCLGRLLPFSNRTIIGVHISTVVLLLCTSIPPLYLAQLGIMGAVIHNIMTCRTFRLVRLSQSRQSDTTTSTSFPLDSVLFAIPQEYGADSHQTLQITPWECSSDILYGETRKQTIEVLGMDSPIGVQYQSVQNSSKFIVYDARLYFNATRFFWRRDESARDFHPFMWHRVLVFHRNLFITSGISTKFGGYDGLG